MTEEEHITRAMLLGMIYNRVCNYYVNTNIRTSGKHYYRLDADTLEELDLEETRRRQHIASQRHP